MGWNAGHEFELNSVWTARRRTRDLFYFRRARSFLDGQNRVRRDVANIFARLVSLQQSERIFIRRSARRDDANPASRTARRNSAQFHPKNYRRSDAGNFHSLLRSVSDSD